VSVGFQYISVTNAVPFLISRESRKRIALSDFTSILNWTEGLRLEESTCGATSGIGLLGGGVVCNKNYFKRNMEKHIQNSLLA
jgi:hypothetical protein